MLAPSPSAVKYKPEDLKLAAVMATTPVVLIARKDIPASNIDEFIAWPRAQRLVRSVGPGSLYHLLGEKLAAKTGLRCSMCRTRRHPDGSPTWRGQVDFAFFALADRFPA
jgi:tripartite-type tricarboxylate transporter receptor subunit TctC